jgi:hypothetical protein
MSGSAIASIDANGGVMCQPVPTYTAGSGLLLTAGAFSVDPTLVQSRVSGVCNSGAIESVLQNGTVTCLTAGTGLAFSTGQFLVDFATTQHAIAPCAAGAVLSKTDVNGTASCISAGTGLAVSGSTWAVDTTAIQQRVTGTCSAGAITSIAADGTVTCGGGGAVATTVTAQISINSVGYTTPMANQPAVTATIGSSGTALVTVTGLVTPPLGTTATMGFAIDNGAASDTQSLQATSVATQASATYLVSGLSPGSHKFTAMYHISNGGGASTFANRSVIVIPQ